MKYILIIFLSLFFFGCSGSGGNDLSDSSSYTLELNSQSTLNDYYTSSVDGDTHDFSTDRIRNYGLEAPELSNSSRLYDQANTCANSDDSFVYNLGYLSKLKGEDILVQNQYYDILIMDIDIYGRTIGTIKMNDSTFAIELVKSGFAVPNLHYINEEFYKNDLINAMNEAILFQNGLWLDYHDFMDCLSKMYD